MTKEPSVSPTQATDQSAVSCRPHHSLGWGAVLAGTIAALGIFLLLTTLGMGIRLTVFRHLTETHPLANFSAGAAMTWSLFAIIALSLGGWVAGRCSACLPSGCLHGALVWSLALICAGSLLSAGAGLKRIIIHHETWVMNGRIVASEKDDLTREQAKRGRDELRSFTEEAVQSIPTNAAPKAATRAQREVGFAVTKLFAPGNATAFPANRLEAINALMVYTEMNAAFATTTIDAWTTSCKNLQTELDKIKSEQIRLKAVAEQQASALADAKANANADQAAYKHSWAAKWTFFALLIGLVGAALGGRCGARCALQNRNRQCAPVVTVQP
jgi:hypothetical protein